MPHIKIEPVICFICLIINNVVYARPISELIESQAIPETQQSLESNHTETKPSEIQKAVCTVTSGDVKASAEAFTTRELKGVCGSAEMTTAFANLENILNKELQDIRKLLSDLHQRIVVKHHQEPNVTERPATFFGSSSIPPFSIKLQPILSDNKVHKNNEISKNYYMTPKLKSLTTRNHTSKMTSIREQDKDVKVYTYYWRMENFTKNNKNENSTSVESPLFSIKGKSFKIKAFFQHLHRDFLYLQLEDCSSSPQLNLGNSILLDTGGIFKEINGDNFKYKMSILDQSKRRSSNLVSQEFDNHESGFLIPNSALIDSPFIKDDSLLIQIFLYL